MLRRSGVEAQCSTPQQGMQFGSQPLWFLRMPDHQGVHFGKQRALAGTAPVLAPP